MTREEREYRDEQITDFRYRLVAELANPYLSAAERRALILHKANVEHEVPFAGPRKYTAGCIANWLAIYRKHGRAGLAPRARRDAGRPRSLSETEGALLLSYLEGHPEMTAAAVLRKTADRRPHSQRALQLGPVATGALGRPTACQASAPGSRRAEPQVRVLRAPGMRPGRLHARDEATRRQGTPTLGHPAGLPGRRHPQGGLWFVHLQRELGHLRDRRASHPGRPRPHRQTVLRQRRHLRQQPDSPHPRLARSGAGALPTRQARRSWQDRAVLPHCPPAVPGPSGRG